MLTHDTCVDFDVFPLSNGGAQGPGIYMLQLAPERAHEDSHYGDRTLRLVVRMRNPFVFYPSEESPEALVNGELLDQALGAQRAAEVVARMDEQGLDACGFQVRNELHSRGHGGIVMVYPGSPGYLLGDNVVIACDARQVNLAYGNSGDFTDSPSLSDRPPARAHARARMR